jgi:hypothetical protein
MYNIIFFCISVYQYSDILWHPYRYLSISLNKLRIYNTLSFLLIFKVTFFLIVEPDSSQSTVDMSDKESELEKTDNGKEGSVLPSRVPSHLLMISILEHLCLMYAQDSDKGKQLFQGMYLI